MGLYEQTLAEVGVFRKLYDDEENMTVINPSDKFLKYFIDKLWNWQHEETVVVGGILIKKNYGIRTLKYEAPYEMFFEKISSENAKILYAYSNHSRDIKKRKNMREFYLGIANEILTEKYDSQRETVINTIRLIDSAFQELYSVKIGRSIYKYIRNHNLLYNPLEVTNMPIFHESFKDAWKKKADVFVISQYHNI